MSYFKMIKTENTDSQYEFWSQYRNQLTTYIKKGLEENCRKNSWVAIWGAGGCNDIDICELSKEYKLLLIDQDIDKLRSLREELGLSKEVCKVADVGFWTITDEDYEMFEALIMDGATIEEFQDYFADLIKNMPEPIKLNTYNVDCSVAVGLASQLNARFAALLYFYKDKIKHIDINLMHEEINKLNQLATERLYISLRQLTKSLVITGYELCSCYSNNEAEDKANQLIKCFEKGIYGGDFLSGMEQNFIEVAGNEYWHKLMYKAIIMDKLEELGMCQSIIWPFTKEKYYPMLMLALACK
ncbi:MAG: hypothetical protein IKJ73_01665 [Lachnospiraceae bacterium]|nr:hypothetical protein [Lachnospiraceae bacterium]